MNKKNSNITIFIILLTIILLIIGLVCLIKNVYNNNVAITTNLQLKNSDYLNPEEELVNDFGDLIAQYETWYNEQNINRSTNIKLAVEKINGTVILPGEIFSYNNIVGNRTELAGFKTAPMYQNGKIVDGIGGGICQVSSTLYNVAIYANLEIIERKNHQFLPAYIQPGRDATVTDGYVDFKFKNTRTYPIKLICSAESGILTVKLYGKKQPTEYNIEIQTTITQTMPYETVYEKDSNLNKGEQEIIQNGKNGYISNTYKIIKLKGEIISKVLISTDKYNVLNEIIKVGTKENN